MRACVRVCLCSRVSSCVRASVRASEPACVRAHVHAHELACERTYQVKVRACRLECVRACVRACACNRVCVFARVRARSRACLHASARAREPVCACFACGTPYTGCPSTSRITSPKAMLHPTIPIPSQSHPDHIHTHVPNDVPNHVPRAHARIHACMGMEGSTRTPVKHSEFLRKGTASSEVPLHAQLAVRMLGPATPRGVARIAAQSHIMRCSEA